MKLYIGRLTKNKKKEHRKEKIKLKIRKENIKKVGRKKKKERHHKVIYFKAIKREKKGPNLKPFRI